MTLTWTNDKAYRNAEVVGSVEPNGKRWGWRLAAVRGSHITRSFGAASTQDGAKRALGKAWDKWCEAFGLVPA